MFLKMISEKNRATLVSCDIVHWRPNTDSNGARLNDDMLYSVEPGGQQFVVPVDTQVYIMNDDGKTVDAFFAGR